MTSFGCDPSGRSPLTVTAIVLGRSIGKVWVASTYSTCEVPMPNASARRAVRPRYANRPQTIVRPGWVIPSCRTDHVHDALLGITHRVELHAEVRAVLAQCLDLRAAGPRP